MTVTVPTRPPASPDGAGTPTSLRCPGIQSVPAPREGRKARGSILSGIQGRLQNPKRGLVFVFFFFPFFFQRLISLSIFIEQTAFPGASAKLLLLWPHGPFSSSSRTLREPELSFVPLPWERSAGMCPKALSSPQSSKWHCPNEEHEQGEEGAVREEKFPGGLCPPCSAGVPCPLRKLWKGWLRPKTGSLSCWEQWGHGSHGANPGSDVTQTGTDAMSPCSPLQEGTDVLEETFARINSP